MNSLKLESQEAKNALEQLYSSEEISYEIRKYEDAISIRSSSEQDLFEKESCLVIIKELALVAKYLNYKI